MYAARACMHMPHARNKLCKHSVHTARRAPRRKNKFVAAVCHLHRTIS